MVASKKKMLALPRGKMLFWWKPHSSPNPNTLMARLRDFPCVHVSYLSKLIAGEAHCEWAAWFKSRHYYDRRPRQGEYIGSEHQIKHTKMLRKERDELESEGFTVTLEKQNDFVWKGSLAKLAGTPDIIAINGEERLIVDVKSGMPCASHEIQLMIYMWAVPNEMRQYKGKEFRGLLVYEDEHRFIENDRVTDDFISDVAKLIRKLASPTPCIKVPSVRECLFCPINETDCPDRANEEELRLQGDGESDTPPNDIF